MKFVQRERINELIKEILINQVQKLGKRLCILIVTERVM